MYMCDVNNMVDTVVEGEVVDVAKPVEGAQECVVGCNEADGGSMNVNDLDGERS